MQTTGRNIPEWGKWLISLLVALVLMALIGAAFFVGHWLADTVPAQWWGPIFASVVALGIFAVIVWAFYQMLFGE